MRVNSSSSKDTGETRTTYVWCNSKIIMWGSGTDYIIRELFKSFLHNYQEELKIIKGSKFIFESVELIDYKLHRVHLKRGGSYVKSPEWLLHKGASVNSKNKNDDECLRWSTISSLNYNKIMKKEFENIFKKNKQRFFIIAKRLNKITSQLLLIYYFHHKIVMLVYKSEHNLKQERRCFC